MHIRGSMKTTYYLDGCPLQTVFIEKDLGCTVSHTLSSYANAETNAKRASNILPSLKRLFGKFNPKCSQLLYNSFVRSHLENGIVIWPPHLQKDKLLLETVQRRATKAVRGLKTRPYEERLNSLIMYSLKYGRLRSDLVLTFLIMQSPEHPWRLIRNKGSSVTLRGPPHKTRGPT
ncbi:hypothetical protein EG68_08409 [Paragonimus skrjabini miyazakii]|uniref:Uncharacterized protein n=1 Tax=Paragonimus skrjabini miyazakii TaxID=59628 RepID=A0A8S9YU14_9TREM|nr:hypothetical protein EG68_08409 [Paragonimus skrjabini miyazakii]